MTKNSGFLKFLQHGELILVDRGFNNAEALLPMARF